MKKIVIVIIALLALFFLARIIAAMDVFCDKPSERKTPNEWFFMQRAYPSGKINHEVYISSLKIAKELQSERKSRITDPWQFAGPINIGGRLSCVAMHPSDTEIMYAGAASGGIFKSTDEGVSWIPVFDDALSLSIGDIAIAPSDPAILYVGTGEANAGGGSLAYDGVGVYKSEDAGENWEYIGLENSRNVGRIVISNSNPDVVFVAVMGDLFGDNPDRGVYKSINGGATWEQSLFINDSTGAIDIAIHPANPDTLFAAMWERVRRPDRRSYGGQGCGIFRSTDGGDSWEELSNGLPSPSYNVGRIGLSVSISDPNIIYSIYADKTGYFSGVYRSENYGDTWNRVNDGALSNLFSSFGWWFGRLRVDPVDPDIVYAMGLDLYKTTNGGASWSNISGWSIHVDQHGIYSHPLNNNLVILGNDGGFYKSTNQGTSWTHIETLPVNQFYTCEIDYQIPERLYGGTQDNGTNRTLTGNINDWGAIYGGDGFYVLVDPTDNNYIYAESQYGNLGKSTNGGYSFYGATYGISGSDRTNWNTPVVFNPLNPKSLYYGSNRLYKSTDRAAYWEAISPDLTSGPGGGNLTYGTITTIAVSPADTNIIYVGTDDSHVWRSSNNGGSWVDISTPLPNRWVTRVAADPEDPYVAYVTFSGYRHNEFLPHVFRTENGGLIWQDISGNLPEIPVNDIIVDPNNTNILFLATDAGVFYTTNLGEGWDILGDSLPNVPINDILLHQPTRTIVAGTYGRSMYKLFVGDTLVLINEQNVADVYADLLVFPSPASDQINFFCNQDDASATVYTLSGKIIIEEETVLKGMGELDISYLIPGVYFIVLRTQTKTYTAKFTKL